MVSMLYTIDTCLANLQIDMDMLLKCHMQRIPAVRTAAVARFDIYLHTKEMR